MVKSFMYLLKKENILEFLDFYGLFFQNIHFLHGLQFFFKITS